MMGRPPFGLLVLPGAMLDGALVIAIKSDIRSRRLTVRLMEARSPFSFQDELTVNHGDVTFDGPMIKRQA
jgi:hypothetical protein